MTGVLTHINAEAMATHRGRLAVRDRLKLICCVEKRFIWAK